MNGAMDGGCGGIDCADFFLMRILCVIAEIDYTPMAARVAEFVHQSELVLLILRIASYT